uniref:Uncharacterized protein n=1 Tax=Arundo donax TaxID=35708 RepID=A0A0A9HT93_ARUDO
MLSLLSRRGGAHLRHLLDQADRVSCPRGLQAVLPSAPLPPGRPGRFHLRGLLS